MKKTIIILYSILVSTLLYGQDPQPFFELNAPEPPNQTRDYLASEYISLMPSFHADPNSDQFVRAHIDPLMVFPPEEGIYGGPNPGDDGVVGTLPGGVSVTPLGGVAYTIPIDIPPGTGGMTPSIALSYNSQSGNGFMGIGWSIEGLSSINRVQTSIYNETFIDGVDFDDNDKFALDGQRLIPINGGDEYRTEVETFSQIIPRAIVDGQPTYFEVRTKDGRIIQYGNTSDSRIEVPGRSDVLSWMVNRISDRKGNYIDFVYIEEFGIGRISQIRYTGSLPTKSLPYYDLAFHYLSVRNDPMNYFVAGSEIKIESLLDKIDVKYNGSVLKSYFFNYDTEGFYTHLLNVVLKDKDGDQLNPTVFEWGDQTANFNKVTTNIQSSESCDYTMGDFNGDGKTDVVRAYYEYNQSVKIYSEWTISYSIENGMLFQEVEQDTLPEGFLHFRSGDFDGNGFDDLVLVKALPGVSDCEFQHDFTYYFFASQGYDQYHNYNINPCEDTYSLVGDLNGNGIDELIHFRHDGGDWTLITAEEYNPRTELIEFLLDNGDEFGYSWEHDLDLDLFQTQTGDFNGDGKTDLLVNLDELESTILTYNEISKTLIEIPEERLEYPNMYYRVYTGDFNGDGITDILTNAYENPEVDWELFYFDGLNNWMPGDCPIPSNLGTDPEVTGNEFIISDYNGDGKSDIYIGVFGEDFETGSPCTWINVFYSNGISFYNDYQKFPGLNTAFSSYYYPHFDYNGDGKSDIFFNGYFEDAREILFFHKNEKKHLVHKFYNGLGAQTDISYRPLTDAIIYSKEIEYEYPLTVVQPPLLVASQISSENGIGGFNITTFSYKGLLIHREGKGVLGYNNITFEKNPLTNHTIKSVVTNSFNEQYYFTYNSSIDEYMDNPYGDLINTSSTIIADPIVEPYDQKRIFFYTPSTLSKYYHTGDISSYYIKTIRQDKVYNEGNDRLFGNVSEIKVYIDENPRQLSDPVTLYNHSITKSLTYNYSGINEWLVNRVQTVYIEAKSNEDPTGSIDKQLVQYLYENNTPLVTNEMVTPNGSAIHIVEKEYLWDDYGNIKKVTISAPNWSPAINPKIIDFTYSPDYQYRFITGKTQSVNNISFSENYTYYPEQGLPSSYKDINGLVTTYFYDNFGRLIKTILPDKVEKHNALRWSGGLYNNPDKGLYMSWSRKSGSPADTTFYDELSRELLYVTSDFNGTDLFVEKEYNDDGLLYKESEPYFAGEDILWTTYNYLTDGKLKSILSPTINIEFGIDGRTSIKTDHNTDIITFNNYNALDKLISAGDPGGVITYDYLSSGSLYQIHYGGNTTTITYDKAGFQESLDDPDAGLTQYLYSPFGELIKQEDAKHNIYQMTYDELGRIKEKYLLNQNHLTYYLYDQDTKGQGKPSWATNTWNGMSTHYTYDNLGRLATKSEVIENETYTYSFTYDVFGNLKTKTWPDDFSLSYKYKNGYLGKVIEPSTGLTIWELDAMNSKGMITQARLGNGLTTTKSYTPTGYLTDIQTGQVQHLSYLFDEHTGNLTWRKDQTTPGILLENFTYDTQLKNRLETWQVQGNPLFSIDYSNNGNFESKSDVGSELLYGPQPGITSFAGPNALSKVNYPDAAFLDASRDRQEIFYTGFNKAERVINTRMVGLDPDIFSLEIEYGPDNERRISRLTHNNNPVKNKIFISADYEIETDGENNTREIHYIAGGDGLCAVYVTDTENPFGKIYYILKDHLGSFYAVTDQQGEIVNYNGEKQVFSFDPWGRRRNPNDWTFNNVPTQFIFDRGFTQHEHLDELGLINMNGRMYDPLLGRFPNPDPFIQSPEYSQSYNRYSYCMNNPLKYIDPSGYYKLTGPGSGNHWSDELRGERGNFNIMSERTFVSIYGQDEYDKLYYNEVTLTGDAAQSFYQQILNGWKYYPLWSFGRYTLLTYQGELGPIERGSNGGILPNSNTTAYVYRPPVEIVDNYFAAGQGGDYSLFFNGQTLSVIQGDNTVYSTVANSGKGEHMNNPNSQKVENLGPIPEGNYFFYNYNWQHQSKLRQVYNIIAGNGDWGDYNVPLNYISWKEPRPLRWGFYLHGGFWPGSAGCVDAGGGISNIYNYVKDQRVTYLRVQY